MTQLSFFIDIYYGPLTGYGLLTGWEAVRIVAEIVALSFVYIFSVQLTCLSKFLDIRY